MPNDFESFVMRGNVVDLAVSVIIIGAAFGKIIGSFVDDLVMPLIGAVAGGRDFSNFYQPLSSAIHSEITFVEAKSVGAALGYGQFLTIVVNFLIIAFVVFLAIRMIEKPRKPAAAEEAAPAKSEVLLEEIRDLLKSK